MIQGEVGALPPTPKDKKTKQHKQKKPSDVAAVPGNPEHFN